MSAHECRKSDGCTCYLLALEPAEDCPQHGHPWPPRCGDCGKFLPWPKPAAIRAQGDDHAG